MAKLTFKTHGILSIGAAIVDEAGQTIAETTEPYRYFPFSYGMHFSVLGKPFFIEYYYINVTRWKIFDGNNEKIGELRRHFFSLNDRTEIMLYGKVYKAFCGFGEFLTKREIEAPDKTFTVARDSLFSFASYLNGEIVSESDDFSETDYIVMMAMVFSFLIRRSSRPS